MVYYIFHDIFTSSRLLLKILICFLLKITWKYEAYLLEKYGEWYLPTLRLSYTTFFEKLTFTFTLCSAERM